MSNKDSWNPSIERQYELMVDFGWQLYSSLNGSMARYLGEQELYDITERILATHQRHYFVEGLKRLNLDREKTDAIRCGKYHWQSNMVGGLEMGFAAESEDKAWVFYLCPTQLFCSGTGISVFKEQWWSRSVRGWHSKNGRSLGNPGLVAVVTHSLFRGDPYDAMYFLDTHESLTQDETFRENWGEKPPAEMTVSSLASEAWPVERRVKGLRNYLLGWVASTLYDLITSYGVDRTAEIFGHAYKILLFQRIHALESGLEVGIKQPFASATIMKRLQQVFAEEIELEGDTRDRRVVRQGTSRLHTAPEFRDASGIRFPAEIERSITEAWVAFARYLDPGMSVDMTHSMAAGDTVLEWTFRR